jgi:hypothetical protein
MGQGVGVNTEYGRWKMEDGIEQKHDPTASRQDDGQEKYTFITGYLMNK